MKIAIDLRDGARSEVQQFFDQLYYDFSGDVLRVLKQIAPSQL
jgi:hypothetical protein